MRTEYLAAIALAAFATGAGWTAYSVQTADYCPPPSAASVTALFAPCQTYAAAMGPAITPKEAMDVGFPPLAPPQQPAPRPSQLIADDFQAMAQEHATVGVAH
jgi:hypothetical protein